MCGKTGKGRHGDRESPCQSLISNIDLSILQIAFDTMKTEAQTE
jgi:hypothetical protein